MADKKISELDAVGTSADTDQIPVVQSGTTKRATLAQLMSAGGVEGLEAAWSNTVVVEGDNSTRTTKATAVQTAVDAAAAASKSFVFVPHSFLDYDASAVTFDNSVRMVREGQVSDVYDVKAYGAAGDGAQDDVAAIQAAIDACVSGVAAEGTVAAPPSTYAIASSITVSDVRGFHFRGGGSTVGGANAGTILLWTGNAGTDHMWELPDLRDALFENFSVTASQSGGSPTLDSAFHLVHGSGTQTPTGNTWKGVRIQGTDGGVKRGWFFDDGGAGGNVNNDLNAFIRCEVVNYDEEAWRIQGNQSKSHDFISCAFNGGSTGKHGIWCAGSFRWYGGSGGGGFNSIADFLLSNPSDNILIDGGNFEGSRRLLTDEDAGTAQSGTNPKPLTVRNVRWGTGGLDADGFITDYRYRGPHIFENNLFLNSNPGALKLGFGESSIRIVGNVFAGNSQTDIFFNFTNVYDAVGAGSPVELTGNAFSVGGTLTIPYQFADQDATPSVAWNTYWETQNTMATTITGFDDGYVGQEIVVVFKDANTTIDFTGTNLKGNAGVDWTPAVNDHMTCVYDGTNWYCDISDNTA